MVPSEYIIIDTHVHPKRGGRVIINEILKIMEEYGVTLSFLLARDTDPCDLDRPEIKRYIISRLINSDFLQRLEMNDYTHLLEIFELMRERLRRTVSNKELASYVNANPDKFIGLGSINLSKSEDYVRSKLREIDELGLAGVKFWPQLQFFNPVTSENLRIVCMHFQRVKKVIMVHTGTCPGPWEIPELSEYANPKNLEPILKEYDVPIILAHFGYYSATCPGIWFQEALELGERYTNVWFDVSAVTYILRNERIVEKIRRYVGFERVLFGSDYLEYVKPSIDIILTSPYLKEEEKKLILGFNAVKLFNLKFKDF
jgi:predicted TIM-barrel fold metal-dependent hydrolase